MHRPPHCVVKHQVWPFVNLTVWRKWNSVPFCLSPWYNPNSWLGVKHQLTYSILVHDSVWLFHENALQENFRIVYESFLFFLTPMWLRLFSLSGWWVCCGEQCHSVLCTQSVGCGRRHEESTGCLQASCGGSRVWSSVPDSPQSIRWETLSVILWWTVIANRWGGGGGHFDILFQCSDQIWTVSIKLHRFGQH